MSRHTVIAGIISTSSLFLPAEAAQARSLSERTGFNFGTMLRNVDSSDRTSAGSESDKSTQSASNSSLVTPYLGYTFDSFGIGLSYTSESRANQATEITASGEIHIRNTSQLGQGLSLYGRFLFAEVFFFETGLGLFQDSVTFSDETRNAQDNGSFEGKSDSYVIKGTGPGYHAAVGVELPITAGFYFTTMYQTRMVTLWDYKGGSDLGTKRSQTQKREVLFGIAYYNQ